MCDATRHRRARTWLIRIGAGVAALVVVLAVAIGAAAIWLHTDGGHRFVARRIEGFVGAQIAGRMRIGSLTDLSSSGLRVHDLRFFAPDDSEVLVVDDADVDLSWTALVERRFVILSARARGGRVTLHDAGHGLGFDLAFRGPHRGNSHSEPDARPPIDLRNIEATGVRLSLEVHGVPTIVASELRGVLHAWLPYAGGRTRLEVQGVGGRVTVHTAIPIALAISAGTVHFDAAERERANVDLHGTINDVRVHWTHTITQEHDGLHVASVLSVPNVGGVLREAPLIAEAAIAELVSSHFAFTVRIAPTGGTRAAYAR